MARVLVVDDDPMARRFTMGCLEAQGYDLQDAEPTCLFRILSILHEAPPDLLITDLVMPDSWIREVLMNPGARAQICSMTYPSRSI